MFFCAAFCRAESGKPVALVAARQGTGHDDAVVTSTHAGFPVLDGVSQFLKGVHALFEYRDFLLRETHEPEQPDSAIVEKWGIFFRQAPDHVR